MAALMAKSLRRTGALKPDLPVALEGHNHLGQNRLQSLAAEEIHDRPEELPRPQDRRIIDGLAAPPGFKPDIGDEAHPTRAPDRPAMGTQQTHRVLSVIAGKRHELIEPLTFALLR